MIKTMDTRSYTSSTTTATTGRNEFAMPGKYRVLKDFLFVIKAKEKLIKKLFLGINVSGVTSESLGDGNLY